MAIVLAGPQIARAQAGPFILDPGQSMYTRLRHIEGRSLGDISPYTSVGATTHLPLDNGVLLIDGQFLLTNNGDEGGNIGFVRRLFVADGIVGAGFWYDVNVSRNENLFQQLSVSLEVLRENWSIRGNGYFVVGPSFQQSITNEGPLFLQGTAVGRNVTVADEQAMHGVEAELARDVGLINGEIYAGYYNFQNEGLQAHGIKGGLRGYLTPNLAGDVTISNDALFGTNVFGGITLFFDRLGGVAPRSLDDKLIIPVERNSQVAIRETSQTNSVPLSDQATGDLIHAFFVTQGGAGTGTQADPTNLAAAQADANFGAGSVIVLLDAGGAFTTNMVFNDPRQQLIGAGDTGTANINFQIATGSSAHVLSLTGLGGRPILMPAAGIAVTLDSGIDLSDNRVEGFTIDGAGGAVVGIGDSDGAGGIGATNTLINDMTIQNLATAGISIQPSIGTTISNVNFSGNGMDIILNANNTTISDIVSNNAGTGISLGVGGDITGFANLSNIQINNPTTNGIVFANAQSDAQVTATDVSVDGTTAGVGVSITDSDAGATFAFANTTVNNVSGTGVSLLNSSSNVTFTTLNITTAAQGVVLSGNSGTFNFNGGTLQTFTGNGVRITDDTSTNSLTGVTITGATGSGLIVDNQSGTGTLNFNNSALNNSGTGVTLDVSGGGTLNLNGVGNSFSGNTLDCNAILGGGVFSGSLDFGASGTCP